MCRHAGSAALSGCPRVTCQHLAKTPVLRRPRPETLDRCAIRIAALSPFFYCEFSGNGLSRPPQGSGAMTDLSGEIPQDDLRNLRLISACTSGLWAFSA